MDLSRHYNKLYEESVPKIREGNYILDNQIDSLSDNRFGITLIIRPNTEIKNNIQQLLQEIRSIDPEQYYYPNSDIHITVISIISCYNGFDLKKISVSEYVDCIQKSLVGINAVEIHFRGITVSPSAIMIQGFVNNSSLDNLRNNLRETFRNSGLEESIDKRYSIATAHSTVLRFRKEIKSKEKLIETLEKYRNFDFGKCTVNTYELVYNDWYQREQFVQLLHEFKSM